MEIVLIYFFLIAFWVETSLKLRITNIVGLSLFNLSLYLIMLFLCFKILTKRKLIKNLDIYKYIVLLVIASGCSILIKQILAEVPNINIRLEIMSFKNWFDPFIVFFVVFNICDKKGTVKATIFGLTLFVTLTSITTPLISTGILNIGHLNIALVGRAAGFGGENSFASFLVLFIPHVLTYFLFQKRLILKSFFAVLLCITLVAFFTTGSRGGLFSLFVALSTYMYLSHKEKIVKLPSIFGIIITLTFISTISFIFTPSEPKEILTERINPERLDEGLDRYTAGRTRILRYGLKLFLQSPIYGHGRESFKPLMNEFGYNKVAHNMYLTYMVELGIIGLILFLWLLIKIYKYAWQHIVEANDNWNKLFYISYLSGFCGYYFSLLALNEGEPRYMFWLYTAVLYRYELLETHRKEILLGQKETY